MPDDRYPKLICRACAFAHGGRAQGPIAAWDDGVCGWCQEATSVTSPRVFGYPVKPGPRRAVGVENL